MLLLFDLALTLPDFRKALVDLLARRLECGLRVGLFRGGLCGGVLIDACLKPLRCPSCRLRDNLELFARRGPCPRLPSIDDPKADTHEVGQGTLGQGRVTAGLRNPRTNTRVANRGLIHTLAATFLVVSQR